MLFLTHWKISTDNYQAAAKAFLDTNAPVPAGLTLVGRWHAPSSQEGWLLSETDDATRLYQHLAEWGSLLAFETTPVVPDDDAGKALSMVFAS
jgi:hypothetical protein